MKGRFYECIFCKRKFLIGEFRNKLDKDEYDISRLCIKCQDAVFKGEKK